MESSALVSVPVGFASDGLWPEPGQYQVPTGQVLTLAAQVASPVDLGEGS